MLSIANVTPHLFIEFTPPINVKKSGDSILRPSMITTSKGLQRVAPGMTQPGAGD